MEGLRMEYIFTERLKGRTIVYLCKEWVNTEFRNWGKGGEE